MSYPSIFVDGSVLFSKYAYLDLTLLDCSRCEYVNNNIYKLDGKKITKFQKYDL